jgi:hypothetical protein
MNNIGLLITILIIVVIVSFSLGFFSALVYSWQKYFKEKFYCNPYKENKDERN